MNFDQLAQQTAERLAAGVLVNGGPGFNEVVAAAKPIIREAIGTATGELGREIDRQRQKIEDQGHALERLNGNLRALREQFEHLLSERRDS